MNLIQKWILGKSLIDRINSFDVKATSPQLGVRYLIDNGKIVVPSDNKTNYIEEGFNRNEIIYSIIQMVCDKIRIPEWRIYKVVDEQKLFEANRILSNKWMTGRDYNKFLKLKYESLEPIENYNLQQGKLNDLLKYPNEDETWQDFIANGSAWKMLLGDVFQWGNSLSMGANKGIPQAIELLPPQYMLIKANNSFPVKAQSYELSTFNQPFTKQEICHEKYWNPNWDVSGRHLYGFSALMAAWKLLYRNNSGKDASIAKFVNGGLEEIIFMDDQRYDAEQGLAQAQALKIKLAEEYSGVNNTGKRAVSGVKVGTAKLGSTPVELGILESEKQDAIWFCNIWGVPPELFGLVSKTFNNVKEAEKSLTTRSAIPLLTSRRNSLNRKFQTDWGFKGQNIYIDFDTECFGELSVNMKEVMDALSMLTMITPNEEREAIGWETRQEPEADEVWVKTGGRQPLMDYQASAVDDALMREATINSMNDGNNDNGEKGDHRKPNGKTGKERVSYSEKLLS